MSTNFICKKCDIPLELPVGFSGLVDSNWRCPVCAPAPELAPPEPIPVPTPAVASKGDRYNTDKSELSMILEAKHAMEGAAKVLTFGKAKYHRGNWRQGLSHTEICDSMLRHISAYLAGEDCDIESGLPHVDHITCNAIFLAEMTRTHKDKDDRSTQDDTEVEGRYAGIVDTGANRAKGGVKKYERPKY